ncbi:hypothetical protein INT45_008638 [Circinella minor]|uniref:Uncharacterized protein n=1 Tax=Circinella minor TaxID=1195481 RepID=A0A8H7S1F1_9FUNG|nr:hypothetical protein INT45_008638 [Circinella minor]
MTQYSVQDNKHGIMIDEKLHISIEYQKMKSQIVDTYINCEDNKQRQDFINIINSATGSFQPPPIESLILPCSVRAKGRPLKRAIGSRLSSGYEIEEKNMARQIKDSKILKEKEASKKKNNTSLPEIKDAYTASPNKRSRAEEDLVAC